MPARSASISSSRAWTTSRRNASPSRSVHSPSCSSCDRIWPTSGAACRATTSSTRSCRKRCPTRIRWESCVLKWGAKEHPMAKAETQAAGAAAEVTELGLLDQIVDQGRFGKEGAARERGKDMVKQFVSEVL